MRYLGTALAISRPAVVGDVILAFVLGAIIGAALALSI